MTSTTPIELTRRQRKRIQKTDHFLDIAMNIVQEDGLERLTMPRLADVADVAVGGLYRYFTSKNALICGLQVRCAHAFIAFLEPIQKTVRDAPPTARAKAYATAWAAFADAFPVKHMMLDQGLSTPEVILSDSDALAVDRALRPALKQVADALKQAQDEGLLSSGNVWLRTYALWAAIHGVGHFQKRDRFLPEELHTCHVRDLLIDTLFIGWASTEAVKD